MVRSESLYRTTRLLLLCLILACASGLLFAQDEGTSSGFTPLDTTRLVTFVLRLCERLVCVLGGVLFGYLGFKLYNLGFDRGKFDAQGKSKLFAFAVSGIGPGIVFMAFGATILCISLLSQMFWKDDSGVTTDDSEVTALFAARSQAELELREIDRRQKDLFGEIMALEQSNKKIVALWDLHLPQIQRQSDPEEAATTQHPVEESSALVHDPTTTPLTTPNPSPTAASQAHDD